MRVLFQMRPHAGTEPHTSLMCGSVPALVCRWWESGPGVTLGGSYALRVTLLLRIGSDSCATVYKPHQQNDVDGLKHDDEQ